MKKLSLLIPFIVLIIFPPVIYAQGLRDSSTSAVVHPEMSTPGAKLQHAQNNRMENLRNRADTEIDRRIISLTALITRIANLNRLSSDQKTTFTNRVQAEITNLTNIKTKIDADTDFDTLKTDGKSIVSSYRIYALFMPQIRILSGVGVLSETAGKAASLEAALQAKVNQAKSHGLDTTNIEKNMSAISNDILDAQKQAQNASDLVINLTPDGYPGNKTSLQSARTDLQTGRKDLENIRTLVQTILESLKKISPETTIIPVSTSSGNVSSPSASPGAQ